VSNVKPYIPFNTIRTLLPHAYPMLLVDRVTEIKPGKSGKGIKNITFNEQILQGHFPNEPIYPGCLLLESCAQLGAIVMLADHLDQQEDGELTIPEGMESKVEYLASVERFKFLRTTVPGDQIILEARIGRAIRGLASYTVRARVGSEVAAEGTLVVTQRGDG
jgi:3-hydroxyacyl-[acyl-carrier-protein] dehydratase